MAKQTKVKQNKTKQVSIDMLKAEVDSYNEYVEIPVSIQGQSEEFTIKLFPFFKPELIRNLVEELSTFFKNCAIEKVKYSSDEEDDLFGFFIVKYFTDLQFSKSKKAKKVYEEFKIARNTELFKVLIEAFPKESIAKVYEYAYEVIDASAKYETMITGMQKQIEELPLESRNIIFKSKNNNENNEVN